VDAAFSLSSSPILRYGLKHDAITRECFMVSASMMDNLAQTIDFNVVAAKFKHHFGADGQIFMSIHKTSRFGNIHGFTGNSAFLGEQDRIQGHAIACCDLPPP
jgi:hypothetical protein